MKLHLSFDVPDRVVAHALRGAFFHASRKAMETAVASFFDCLTPAELAVHLGVSDSQVRTLVREERIPKDTTLGARLPRYSLAAVKAAMREQRIKARVRPALRVVKVDKVAIQKNGTAEISMNGAACR